MHHPTYRIVHTMAFGTPVIEPETLNAQAVVEQRGGEGGGQHLYKGSSFARKCISTTPIGVPIYISPPGGNTPCSTTVLKSELLGHKDKIRYNFITDTHSTFGIVQIVQSVQTPPPHPSQNKRHIT